MVCLFYFRVRNELSKKTSHVNGQPPKQPKGNFSLRIVDCKTIFPTHLLKRLKCSSFTHKQLQALKHALHHTPALPPLTDMSLVLMDAAILFPPPLSFSHVLSQLMQSLQL